MAKLAEKRKIKAAMLIATAEARGEHLTRAQIAEQLGCSTRQVSRIQEAIAPAVDAADESLKALRTRLTERVPIPAYVDHLAQLCEQREHLPTALNGLNAIARLQSWDAREQAPPAAVQPMFALPAGARLTLTMEQATPREAVEAYVEKRTRSVVDVECNE